MLDLLTVHTVADLKAVGPGVLTDWKLGLIEDLYKRTRNYFLTGNLPGEPDEETEALRSQIEALLERRHAPPLSHQVLRSMPALLLQHESSEALAEHLRQVGDLDDEGTYSVCWHRYLPEQDATEYTLVRRQGRRPIGTFARVTGAFTAAGLEIQRAEIESLQPDIVWDSFVVKDADFAGKPPASRSEDVCSRVRAAVEDQQPRAPSFRRVWKSPADQREECVELLPDRVLFDNETFERYTVLSLFAYDRPGLLYSVALQLVEHEIVLHFAKISTHLDQVVDVFYVSELTGEQIRSESRQQQIREALLQTVSTSQAAAP
jgi:[protein-PII] uridylyltransferase